MFRFAVVLLSFVLVPTEEPPSASIRGGSPEARAMVSDAIDRFDDAGLKLPPLDIRIHPTTDGCSGYQGLFRPAGDVGLIDVCFEREFLVLHELAHAWEHFSLDDSERHEFMSTWGYESWRSRDIPWSKRGIERSADAIATGLSAATLDHPDHHAREFAKYEQLTGHRSPRVNDR